MVEQVEGQYALNLDGTFSVEPESAFSGDSETVVAEVIMRPPRDGQRVLLSIELRQLALVDLLPPLTSVRSWGSPLLDLYLHDFFFTGGFYPHNIQHTGAYSVTCELVRYDGRAFLSHDLDVLRAQLGRCGKDRFDFELRVE